MKTPVMADARCREGHLDASICDCAALADLWLALVASPCVRQEGRRDRASLLGWGGRGTSEEAGDM